MDSLPANTFIFAFILKGSALGGAGNLVGNNNVAGNGAVGIRGGKYKNKKPN